MPKAAATAAGDTVSATELGALLGITARRVRELAEAGRLPRHRGRYPVADAVSAYCEGLRVSAAGRRGDAEEGLDLATERALLARSQREAVELKLARDRGELVNAEQVKAGFVGLVTQARNRLLGVPSKAKARIPTLSVRDVEALEDLIAEALNGLANGGEP